MSKSKAALICSAVGPLGGGLSKSETTMAEGALHRLAGHEIMLVEADPGLPVLTNRLDHDRYSVTAMPSERVEVFASLTLDEAERHGARLVAIDVGGNALLGAGVLANVVRTFAEARTRGGTSVMKIMLRPGKEGLAAEALRVSRAFEPHARIHFIEADVDGSGDFAAFQMVTAGSPVHRLPYIEPGLLRLVSRSRGLMSDVILDPPPGFTKAAGWLARLLLSFARSGDFAAMMGCEAAIPVLEQAARTAPARRYVARTRLWQVSDLALDAADLVISTKRAFNEITADPGDPSFLNASMAYHRAETALVRAERDAEALYGQ